MVAVVTDSAQTARNAAQATAYARPVSELDREAPATAAPDWLRIQVTPANLSGGSMPNAELDLLIGFHDLEQPFLLVIPLP